jgi:hypothetical protein
LNKTEECDALKEQSLVHEEALKIVFAVRWPFDKSVLVTMLLQKRGDGKCLDN